MQPKYTAKHEAIHNFLSDMMAQRGLWWQRDLIKCCQDAGQFKGLGWSPSVAKQAIEEKLENEAWFAKYISDQHDYLLVANTSN